MNELQRDVLFLCDKTVCKDCGKECHHTRDLSHAKNFKLEHGAYVEKNRVDSFEARLMSVALAIAVSACVLGGAFKFITWLLF